tara:strand:- start:1144 stop:1455 length:312 start_codon:yes stop_codon:yes gene_type:complete
MKLERVVKSDAKGKKYTAIFCLCKGASCCKDSDKKKIHFGSEGMDDYTITKDKEQRDRYRARTKSVYNKAQPVSASRLSGDILWGDSTSLQQNIKNYKKKYNL